MTNRTNDYFYLPASALKKDASATSTEMEYFDGEWQSDKRQWRFPINMKNRVLSFLSNKNGKTNKSLDTTSDDSDSDNDINEYSDHFDTDSDANQLTDYMESSQTDDEDDLPSRVGFMASPVFKGKAATTSTRLNLRKQQHKLHRETSFDLADSSSDDESNGDSNGEYNGDSNGEAGAVSDASDTSTPLYATAAPKPSPKKLVKNPTTSKCTGKYCKM